MSKKIKTLTFSEEKQTVIFKASRRGRGGGAFEASSMDELTKLVKESGKIGEFTITRAFAKPAKNTVSEKSEKSEDSKSTSSKVSKPVNGKASKRANNIAMSNFNRVSEAIKASAENKGEI